MTKINVENQTLQTIEAVSASIDRLEQKRKARIANRDHVVASEPVIIPSSSSRVILSPPKPKSKDAMAALIDAFCKLFDSYSKTTQFQTSDLANLELLDTSMAQVVMDSITKSMDEENAAYKKQQKLNEELKKQAKVDKALKYFSYAFMAVMMAFTIASSVLDAGASAAALPEEIELTEAIGEGAMEIAPEQSGDTSLADMGSTVEDDAEGGASLTPDNASGNPDGISQTNVNNEQITEDENQAGLRRAIENNRSKTNLGRAKNALTKWGELRKTLANKYLVKAAGVTGSAVNAMPMIVQGVMSMQTAKYMKRVALAQKGMGQAIARLQENSTYLQFYQQSVQRLTGVVQQLVGQLSNAVQTSGAIMSTYRDVTNGLASSA